MLVAHKKRTLNSTKERSGSIAYISGTAAAWASAHKRKRPEKIDFFIEQPVSFKSLPKIRVTFHGDSSDEANCSELPARMSPLILDSFEGSLLTRALQMTENSFMRWKK
jgi:hypothetical protein